MSKIVDEVTKIVEPIILNNGMELVEVEFKKIAGQDNLTIYIDKDGGVDLNDCELIHNAIDEPLDELDPTNGAAYTLNVSSPGIDRPLKTPRDYEKALTKEDKDYEVSLYKQIELNGKKVKKIEAALCAYDGESVDLDYKGKQIKLNIKDIALIKPVIKF